MRRIIRIDESLCNGCGECITACAEGAIELSGGKARVVSESFCDGLGACLSVCPEGALSIEEREAPDFDRAAALDHMHSGGEHERGCGCGEEHPDQATGVRALSPCSRPISLRSGPGSEKKPGKAGLHDMTKTGEPGENELSGWPIQMRLVRPWAPYLKGSSLLVAGDCTAFAYPEIQRDFIRGRALLVGCPKLDETGPFVERLAEILRNNEIRDITVLHMTVPCCSALVGLVAEAVRLSGKEVPQKSHVVGIDGRLQE